MTRCGLCGERILNRNDSRFCVYCCATFHKDCITEHFYHNKYCPACREKTSLLFMRRGFPPSIEREPAPRKAKRIEWPSKPTEEPFQREIREPEWTQTEEKPRAPVSHRYAPAGPQRTDRYGRRSRTAPLRRDHRERKSLENILSEAASILKENRIIVVPYMIPIILAFIGTIVGFGYFIPTGGQESLALDNLGSLTSSDFDSSSLDDLESLFFGGPESEYGLEFSDMLIFLFSDFTSIIGILCWGFSVVTVAIAVEMTYFSTQGEEITLTEALDEIGAGGMAILLVASMIVTIIFRSPELLIFSGLLISGVILIFLIDVILAIFFVFVSQGILIDHFGIGSTIYNSFKVAKRNFFSILLLALFFTFVTNTVSVSIIREFLKISVALYGTVAYTILYLDRT